MYSYLEARPDVTYLIRVYGGEAEEERWRKAARQAGLRPRRCQGEDGHPALAVTLRAEAGVGCLVELLVREGLSGELARLG